MSLLAAEITAVTGKSPSELYDAMTARYGCPCYSRKDAPATREEKDKPTLPPKRSRARR